MVPANSRVSTYSDELDTVSRLVENFGEYGEGLLDRHDFGIDRALFRSHLRGLNDLLTHARSSARAFDAKRGNHRMPDPKFWDNPGHLWNSAQAQRLSVGACLSSQKFRRSTTPANLERALIAKIAHNCLLGILDDLIDRGNYTDIEAKDLYHSVLSSMVDPEFDAATYGKSLRGKIKPDQFQLVDQMEALTVRFNALWNGTPHARDYFGPMAMLNERIALGQSLTIYQKDPHFSHARLEALAATLFAPSGGLTWWKRLAAHISASSESNLVDIAFSRIRLDPHALGKVLDGLYFVDAAVTLLDHVATVEKDLEDGIANLSLLAMRPDQLQRRSLVRGYHFDLTNEDYVPHLRQIARLTGHGLSVLGQSMGDAEGYYPFLAVMMPVVLLADWIGSRDELIDTYARELAIAMQSSGLGRLAPGARTSPSQEVAIAAR